MKNLAPTTIRSIALVLIVLIASVATSCTVQAHDQAHDHRTWVVACVEQGGQVIRGDCIR